MIYKSIDRKVYHCWVYRAMFNPLLLGGDVLKLRKAFDACDADHSNEIDATEFSQGERGVFFPVFGFRSRLSNRSDEVSR